MSTVYKLRKPQVAILKFLAGAGAGMFSRTTISEEAGVAINALCPMLGSIDPVARAKAEIRGGNCKSLITLEYVVGRVIDVDGLTETVYAITESGRDALTRSIMLSIGEPVLQ